MNQVEGLVYKVLGSRRRVRQETNLTVLYRTIKRMDKTINEKDFLAAFRALEAKGAGTLVIGRKGNPNRFVWDYNLKDAAKTVMKGKSLTSLKPLQETNERLVQFKEKAKRQVRIVKPEPSVELSQANTIEPTLQIVLNLPKDANMTDVKALIELAKELQNK